MCSLVYIYSGWMKDWDTNLQLYYCNALKYYHYLQNTKHHIVWLLGTIHFSHIISWSFLFKMPGKGYEEKEKTD